MRARLVLDELAAARKSLEKATAFIVQFQTTTKLQTPEDPTLRSPTLQSCPISVVTENGFSIVRLGDMEESSFASGIECHFAVRAPDGDERRITVVFTEAALTPLKNQREELAGLPRSARFWENCSENHLATFLWENDCYPSNECLFISSLSFADLVRARRFK